MTRDPRAAAPPTRPRRSGTRPRRGELVLPWCRDVRTAVLVPARDVSRAASATTLEWRAASGDGVVYAASVQHLPGPGRDAADGPYVVALVDLDEGVRMMGNVLECAPDDVHVGMPVRATWEPLSDGRQLLQFAPSGEAEKGASPCRWRSTSVRRPTRFRDEVREWLQENRPADPEAVRSQLIGGGPEHEEWAARAARGRLAVRGVAEGVRRPRPQRASRWR